MYVFLKMGRQLGWCISWTIMARGRLSTDPQRGPCRCRQQLSHSANCRTLPVDLLFLLSRLGVTFGEGLGASSCTSNHVLSPFHSYLPVIMTCAYSTVVDPSTASGVRPVHPTCYRIGYLYLGRRSADQDMHA